MRTNTTLVLLAMLSFLGCGDVSTLQDGRYTYLRSLNTLTPTGQALAVTLQGAQVTVTNGSTEVLQSATSVAQEQRGCPTNYSSTVQETRTMTAPSLTLGGLTITSPLLIAGCPSTSGEVLLQTGPLDAQGRAPECSSAGVVCLTFSR
jgi:hypothetical protein